jgi:Na+-transporting NADH:ubiquinone oxidoreductase subunit D
MSRATFSGNLVDNLWYNNPIFVQILGICSTLAVTNNLTNTAIMTVAVTGVTAMSNLVISLIRDFIPRKVRMIVQTVVIAFWVIVVDILLRAYFFEVSKTLGPYVGLIITNCIIMGRAEAFAQSQGVFISFWDGITSGLGYMGVLMAIAFVRELMGFGTLFGIEILPLTINGGWFEAWTIMITAPSAFFLLGLFIWGAKAIQAKQGVQA